MRLAPFVEMTAQHLGMPSGRSGVFQTLRIMRQMVNQYRTDPVIRRAATNTIFLTPEKDEFSEAFALFFLVRDTIRYTKDVSDVETLSTPDKTLLGRLGDCDDQTTLLASLFESVGYKTRFVVTGYSEPGIFEHVYLQVLVHGEWYACDPTEQGAPFGWEPELAVTKFVERV